jgi:hypothetical protein
MCLLTNGSSKLRFCSAGSWRHSATRPDKAATLT